MKYNFLFGVMVFLSVTALSAPLRALTVDLSTYPEILKIFAESKKSGQNISVFGGTSRDILRGEKISEADQFDILLPSDFTEGELTLDQRAFLDRLGKAAGEMKKCHFIYSKGRETFTKLYSVGGLSLNKIVISMNGKVMDRHGGITDLQKKTLRHVPGVNSYWPSFLPLFDVLRGIRFMTQYPDLNLDPGTMRYYIDAVRQAEGDHHLKRNILAIFKNVVLELPHAQGFPGDSKEFVTTKVQIRGIKDRLDKIFLFARDRLRAERLLEEFGVASFLRSIRWPEKDYTIAKMDPAKFDNSGKVAKAAATGFFASSSIPGAGAGPSSASLATASRRPVAVPQSAASQTASYPSDQTVEVKSEDDGLSRNGYSDPGPADDSGSDSDTYVSDTGTTGDDDKNFGSRGAGGYSADSWSGSESGSGSGDPGTFEDPFEDINFEDFNLDDF